MKKLFIAKARKETIFFDDDGRLYTFNTQTNSLVPTDKFVFLEYYGIPLYLFAPQHFITGWREPIELDATYEIYDDTEAQ